MPERFTFEIITPERLVVSEEIAAAALPTAKGQIGILPGHMSLYALLAPGVAGVTRHQSAIPEPREDVALAGGFVVITGRHVRVFADAAERADDIDELKTKEALLRARQLQREAKDHVSLAEATSLIEHNAARLKVAELKRRRHRAAGI